ncbi:hypothetical protein HY469_00970 [Candidatus Roizmanbacteria bacterium]|nr:hypothetical protein [Candidatus Roizmanbacteria bacterium]
MKIAAPLITIGTLCLLTVFASWRALSSFNNPSENTPQVQGDSDESESTPTNTPTIESIEYTATPTNSPTSTTIPTPTATPHTTNNTTTLSSWIYPGTNIQSQPDNRIVMTSSESSDTITDWYKSKIQSSGYSAKTTVTTKSNGNVNNVLAGAKNNEEIKIEIIKPSDDNTVTITVTKS